MYTQLKGGGFIYFMESIEGHVEKVTLQLMDSQKYHQLRADGVYFEETEEMIANAMGLAMEGNSQRKHPRGIDKMSLPKQKQKS